MDDYRLVSVIGFLSMIFPWCEIRDNFFVYSAQPLALYRLLPLSQWRIVTGVFLELETAALLFGAGCVLLWFHKLGLLGQVGGLAYFTYWNMIKDNVTTIPEFLVSFKIGYFIAIIPVLWLLRQEYNYNRRITRYNPYRALQKNREGSPNWFSKKKTKPPSGPHKRTIPSDLTEEQETKSVEKKESSKTVVIWLFLLTIGVIILGLYSTGNLEGIFNNFKTSEDLTTYTLSDTSNRFSLDTNQITFTALNRRDKNEYVYKSFQETNFIHKISLEITSIQSTQSQRLRFNLLTYSNGLGNYNELWEAGNDQIVISVGSISNGHFYLVLIETKNRQYDGSERSSELVINKEHQVIFSKQGQLVTVEILDNDGNLIDKISYTLAFNHQIEYILCLQSMGYPNGDFRSSGVLGNLIL